jgi:Tol biopolymer transport system component
MSGAAPAERIAFVSFPEHTFALSPDGQWLVYAGWQGAERKLFLRDLGKRGAVALPGTELPSNPAFSPDGQWILYFFGGFELHKVPVRGGSSTLVAHTPNHLGGAMWYDADTIIYSPYPGTGLWRMPAAGGASTQLTFPDFDHGESSHVWPAGVPGSKLILYVAEVEAADTFDAGRIYAFDPASGKRTLLVEGGTDPVVVDDTLHYVRAGTVYAVGFDAAKVALRGSPAPLYEGVMYAASTGAAQYALASGVSVRAPGGSGMDLIDLNVVDRAGKLESLGLPPRFYPRFRIAPEGRRIAIQISGADDDLWIYDLERRTMSRLTDRDENIHPAWTPDGAWIIYTHHREPKPRIWRRRADGTGAPEQLTFGDESLAQLVHDVTPDGRYVLFDQYRDSGDFDIGLFDLETKQTSTWLSTPALEYGARASPDGRFVAYRSNQSGRDEVYVQAFAGARRWQISNEGGVDPRWCPKGGEIYYMLAGTVYAVKLGAGDDLAPGVPAPLIRGGDISGAYDVFPDCERFLVRKRVRDPGVAGPLLIDFR